MKRDNAEHIDRTPGDRIHKVVFLPPLKGSRLPPVPGNRHISKGEKTLALSGARMLRHNP